MKKWKIRNEQILAQYKDNKEIGLKDLQKIELEILKYLDMICRENDIKYFLCGGTVLGAVRHGGFIPWDDDVDVMLFRDEYERLIDILHKKHSRYKILSTKTQNDYFFPFARLVDTNTVLIESFFPHISDLGVCIDIFPIDYFPNDEHGGKRIKRKFYFYKLLRFNSLFFNIPNKCSKGRIYLLLQPICRCIGYKYFDKKLEPIIKKINKEKTKYSIMLNSIKETSWFDSHKMLFFEGYEFPVPIEYDKYLRNSYGDYMKLPPREARVAPHGFKAYYK